MLNMKWNTTKQLNNAMKWSWSHDFSSLTYGLANGIHMIRVVRDPIMGTPTPQRIVK